jgi:hypothetical protein
MNHFRKKNIDPYQPLANPEISVQGAALNDERSRAVWKPWFSHWMSNGGREGVEGDIAY